MCKTIDESKARPDVGCAELLVAVRELKHALDFFDRAQSASEDERIAVGRDHYDWVFKAAKLVVSVKTNANLTGGQKPEKEVSNER